MFSKIKFRVCHLQRGLVRNYQSSRPDGVHGYRKVPKAEYTSVLQSLFCFFYLNNMLYRGVCGGNRTSTIRCEIKLFDLTGKIRVRVRYYIDIFKVFID